MRQKSPLRFQVIHLYASTYPSLTKSILLEISRFSYFISVCIGIAENCISPCKHLLFRTNIDGNKTNITFEKKNISNFMRFQYCIKCFDVFRIFFTSISHIVFVDRKFTQQNFTQIAFPRWNGLVISVIKRFQ